MVKDQPVKIQLNSEAAVRAIIDGDPELQIEIKSKIACAIAGGYEKINTQAIEASSAAIAKVVEGQLINELTEIRGNGWHTSRYFKPEIEAMIKDYVERTMRNIVTEIVDEQTDVLMAMIKDKVEIMSDIIVNRIMDKAFDATVEKEVARKLQAIQKALDTEDDQS
jgi:hypothetical protein